MTIALWLTVCAGLSCHTLPLVPNNDVGKIDDPVPTSWSTQRCQAAAQQLMAAWRQSHPGWRIDHWRCGPEERGA